ncbi:MAG: type II secretion system F family protein [Candidatus Parvarchaeota archaeon]|nr:type II secretion system F family protein [Candidatus Jingweiarchaeum tengchongense]MCW1297939.1 type II secretion system F family protein [Candidatus Jingweiarchaeum tengchongense]MCW1300605.1 type II secretion system F family protein [Candidatus Jingweiarchaeum tengchongense]MCW1304475.1 type II secretion system F family protein [Candidatus Jingweiarchaeum tengchongense]MCW1305642.1 type II secretion system F family protein [Candidatus Jingweiarchaeum tengchongense]
MEKEQKALLISIPAAVGVTVLLLIFLGFSSFIYAIFTGAVIAVLPYIYVKYSREKRLRLMEEKFPEFLRNLADAKRSGMTLSQAIANNANIDYGPLTDEIKLMSNQLSWGIPFPDVIKMFMKRVSGSKELQRNLAIIFESYYAGGDISDTMDAISQSTNVLREVEKERIATMNEQVTVMYIVHFVFIVILIALYKVLIPLITMQASSGGFLGVGGAPPQMSYFKMLFFITLVIQAVCNGVITGEIREGKLIASLKHIGLMLGSALLLYFIFIFPKMFELTVDIPVTRVAAGSNIEISGRLVLEGKPVDRGDITINAFNTTTKLLTNKDGEFKTIIIATNVRGNYTIVVEASYGEDYTKKALGVEIL